ncbi:ribonuclease H-like domain-containing protein [Tanacetum coccineum]
MERCLYTYNEQVGLGLHGFIHGPLLTNYSCFLDSRGRNNNHKKKKSDNISGDASVEPRAKVNDGITGISTARMSSLTEVTVMPNIITGSNISIGTTNETTDLVGDEVMKEIPASYANKLIPTSLTKANLQKVDADVPNVANYYVWLPLASVHEEKYGLKRLTLVKGIFFYKFSSTEGVDSVLRDGPWMILGVLIFLNKWSPFVSLPKEDLSRVPVWEKFHDVLLVAYNSDGLILIATKIGTPLMLDSYTNSMCLES